MIILDIPWSTVLNSCRDPPRALLPGTTVLTPVVAWETATSANAASASSASPAEIEHSQLTETIVSQVVPTATADADNLSSIQTSEAESSGLTTVIITSQIRTALSSLAEAQSTAVVMTEGESSSSTAEPAIGATPNTILTSSNTKTTANSSEDQSPSAELRTFSASSSHESASSEVVTPGTGTQIGLSLSSSGHTTIRSSTHEPSQATQTPSSSRSALTTIASFQGQAARLESTFNSASLLLLILLWL